MQVFAQVVEAGGLAKAADRLGMSTSAASRQVAELEAHLQTRLLNRTTRRVSLTESGRAFYERSVQLLADLQEAEEEASSAAVVPRGTIRLTTSVNFGVRHVAPAIAAFSAAHPDVRFDVSLADRVVDLVEEGFDIAIRIGAPGGPMRIARSKPSSTRSTTRSESATSKRTSPWRARKSAIAGATWRTPKFTDVVRRIVPRGTTAALDASSSASCRSASSWTERS